MSGPGRRIIIMPMTPRPSTVRLQDIADACGVSRATVSRALRDPERHSKALTDRIRDAADSLGYDPQLHQGARRLQMQRHGKATLNHVVGIGLPRYFHHNRYYYAFFAGVLDALTPAGFGTLIMRGGEAPHPACLRRGEVDGMILTSLHNNAVEYLRAEQGFGDRPIIAVGESDEQTCSVIPDFQLGMTRLVELLLSRGVERFIYLCRDTGTALETGKHRRQLHGITAALEAHGFSREEHLVLSTVSQTLWKTCFGLDDAHDEAAAASLLEPGAPETYVTQALASDAPTAVLAPNDALATLALHQLEHAGLRVPQDVQVAGFDGVNPMERFLGTRTLTTVVSPIQACGQQAAEQMLARLQTDPAAPLPATLTKLPTTLRLGDTTSS